MILAVASGKGGTGKTTVATCLARSLVESGRPPAIFLDCDVEAPNAHLYLDPILNEAREVNILIPQVDETRCTHCGKCVEVCQYHAIALLGRKVLVFPQLCHGCGSCTLTCPEVAIKEIPSRVGVIERGVVNSLSPFARGILDVGQPMAVPIIRQLKSWMMAGTGQHVIIDCPPGASCPVVAAIHGADYLLLVTEPSPFGLHDLKQAFGIGKEMGIPIGVVINRWQGDYEDLDLYCQEAGLPVLMRIPYQRRIAEGIARGRTLNEIVPETSQRFMEMFETITSSRMVL